jgi:hypothetical protein
LYTQVGIPIDTRISIGDIKRFEDHFKLTINVFTAEGHKYPIDLENQYDDQVYLFLHNEHVDVLTSPEAFLAIKDNQKFCNGCKKTVYKKTHICDTVGVFVKQLCLKCNEVHTEGHEEIMCNGCNRHFGNQTCFDNHKRTTPKLDSKGEQVYKTTYTYKANQTIKHQEPVNTKSTCEKRFICSSCNVICNNLHRTSKFNDIEQRLTKKCYKFDAIEEDEMLKAIKKQYKKTHICGKMWCNACDDQVPVDNHQCYIGGLNENQKRKYLPTNKIIFYDYETYCDDQTNQHIPNLVVAYRTNKDDVTDYTEHIFSVYDEANSVTDVNTRFCQWLFKNSNAGYTCIAHNSKGYDIHFIKQYLYNNDIKINFSTIDTGVKSMSLNVKSLKINFIDSLSFFSSSLKALP